MQMIKVSELKEHPKNEYYFDNMSGQKWKEFLESVKTSGVIEPIVCNQDKVIISGHQRTRACIELEIGEIMCDIRIYDNKQDEIKDLIETNVRQRGDVSSSSLKMGRIIKTLEEIYDIKRGGDRANLDNPCLTQQDMAEKLGIGIDTYRQDKKLLELIPELQDLLIDGKLTTTVASKILARLPQEEQSKVLEELGEDKLQEMTQKQIKEYIEKKEEADKKVQEVEKEKEELKQQLAKEKSKPKEKEIVTKTVEVDNTDYSLKEEVERLKKIQQELLKECTGYKSRYELEQMKVKNVEERNKFLEENQKEYTDLRKGIELLTEEKESISRQVSTGTELAGLAIKIKGFIDSELAPITYSRALREVGLCDDIVRESLIEIIEIVENWCIEMRSNIANGTNDKTVIVEGVVIE